MENYYTYGLIDLKFMIQYEIILENHTELVWQETLCLALAAAASYMLVAKNNYSQYTQMDKKLLSASISIGNGF